MYLLFIFASFLYMTRENFGLSSLTVLLKIVQNRTKIFKGFFLKIFKRIVSYTCLSLAYFSPCVLYCLLELFF